MSLESFCFATRTRNFSAGKQRHTVDAFRTICWFYDLQISIGAKSCYQMDGLLEDTAAISSNTKLNRKKKWREYRWGRTTPSTQLASAIENKYPNSQSLLTHPLWEALRMDRPVKPQLDRLIGLITPDTYALVANLLLPPKARGLRKFEWVFLRIQRLVREASLEALTCLILLMRLVDENKEEYLTSTFARAIARLLIVLGGWFSSRGIALPLAEYFEHVLLRSMNSERPTWIYGSQGYLFRINLLEQAVDKAAIEKEREPTRDEIITICLKMLWAE